MPKITTNIISFFLMTIVWQALCSFNFVDEKILPSPYSVFLSMLQLIGNGELFVDSIESISRVLIGFSIALFIALTLSIIVTSNRISGSYLTPLIELVRPVPPIAFVSFSIMWFGIGDGSAYFLVFLGAFFPIFSNAVAGINSVSQIHKDAAKCLGANQWLLLTDVIIPSALPNIMTGMKIGLGTAWFCVIVAELVGAQSGLGYMIQLNRLTLQSEKVLVGMITIGLLGYSMNRIMTLLHNKIVPWKINSNYG